ncbi:MAG: hypothetical protein KGQ93_07435 [Cyanobacteria bacterium REEB459]|nr:hypothetical protein [Cyanobacteria bacterium REEB459]
MIYSLPPVIPAPLVVSVALVTGEGRQASPTPDPGFGLSHPAKLGAAVSSYQPYRTVSYANCQRGSRDCFPRDRNG